MKRHCILVLVLFGSIALMDIAAAGDLTCSLSGTMVNGKCEDCGEGCDENDDTLPNPEFTIVVRPSGGACGFTPVTAGGSYSTEFDVVLVTTNNPTIGEELMRVCFDPMDPKNPAGGFDTTSRTGECDFGSQVQPGIFDPWLGDPRNPAVLDCGGSTTRPDASTGDIVCEMDGADVIRMTTFADDGAQGWSYGLAEEGSLNISGFTTEGTVSANFRDGGLERGGFVETQLTVGTNAAGNNNNGIVSAIVAAQNLPIVIAPSGEAIILIVTVDGAVPAGQNETNPGRLYFPTGSDFLLKGSGEPVPSLVTFDGRSVSVTSGHPPLDPATNLPDCAIALSTDSPPAPKFIRCDPNNDGRVDIADPIWILNELFRSGPATVCGDAADCNGDGMIDGGMGDMSDVVYAIAHQWMGGTEPPAPFGATACEEAPNAMDCPLGSTTCGS